MKPRIIYIHGNGSTRWTFGWAPWLKQELESRGYESFFETFPDSIDARAQYWLPFLEKHAKAGPQDVIVGWSSGAVAAMRYAETHRIRGSILVSPTTSDLGDEHEKLSGYFDTPWEWESIRNNQEKIVILRSNDDPYIPQEQFAIARDNLRAEEIEIPGGGHFVKMTEFPELLHYILKNYP